MRMRALWLFPAVCILFASSPVRAIPVHHWSKNFGSSSITTDDSGNVVITGSLFGTVDFGGGPLTSAGSVDVFVAKFDVSGNHLWSKRFGDEYDQLGEAAATDGSGNVVITGYFVGTVDFGGGPLTSAGYDTDIFVAKFDANGNHLWSQSFDSGSYGLAAISTVAVDGSGNVVIAAQFLGTVDFGGGPLTSAGNIDIAVAKFDANGSHVWSQRFGDDSYQISQSVAADGSGNVAVTGYFGGTVDFGGGPLTSLGEDMFVAEFDANGNHLWSRHFGGTTGYSVATDGSSNVVVTGYFSGTVDFGGGPLTGSLDIFLAKFDLNGNHIWSQRFGDADQQIGQSVAVDGSGNVVVTGHFYGTVDFGGGPLTAPPFFEDIFLAKFDADGTHLWSEGFGSEYNDRGLWVAADGAGGVVLTGFIAGPVDFGGGSLGGGGFLVRFMEEEPIPVLITRFEAASAGAGIEVRWEVRSDEDIESFALYRSEDARLAPITVASGPFQSNVRSFWDAKVEVGRTYTYELMLRTSAGSEFRSPAATATVRALQATLEQNHPNPFNPSTTIAYTLDEQTQVAVGVYDAAGTLVVRLDQGVQTAGRHEVTWNGVDSSGNAVGSGVYFYRLETRSGAGTRKMVLLK